jgi:hypothetical protein
MGLLLVALGIGLAVTSAALEGFLICVGGVLLALAAPILISTSNDPCGGLSRLERISVGGIWLQTSLRKTARSLLLPGAWITVVAVATYGILQLSKALSKPDIWSAGSEWNWTLLAAGVPAILGSVLVSIGYPRLVRRVERDARLQGVCQDTAVLAGDRLRISHRKLAVHVWTIRGLVGFRYLDRRAAYRPHEHPYTRITWRKGKGAVGAAWESEEPFVADVEALERQGNDERRFCQLDAHVRFGLSWKEFQQVRHYRSVLVIPLRGGDAGRYSLRGIFAVGVLVDGKVNELEQFVHAQGLVRVLSVCEAELAGVPSGG